MHCFGLPGNVAVSRAIWDSGAIWDNLTVKDGNWNHLIDHDCTIIFFGDYLCSPI